MNYKKIFLIGPMGSGKTTIGKILSNKINFNFFDSDDEIIKKMNKSINNIFNIHGELYFRNIEKEIIKYIYYNNNNIVLSTGGGSIEDKENRKIFKKGLTIFLNVNINNQINRISNNINRPLLSNNEKDNIDILYDIYKRRINYYINSSNIIINTDNLSINTIIKYIIKIINKIK
ncbi:shikimate kinase [Candidatus Nardonella dryophthoridicola]|uniref:Shikimate kinase n=1 Tax=endosymbiont of Rhynchophorus ferrugineus TaxID=1972133 RepID=A0A2Z5TH76_9GAMM|nr:shikimate kinase [Candidatus Nardonella dryophthoridicola]QTJ62897.1 shikimate kinase [Candidatus Nardonella dryophthoridicola]BBA85143.1 shikimate kinase [endosymbiont of Rhynchophorus ferrugineus]